MSYNPKNYEFGEEGHQCLRCGAAVYNCRKHDEFHDLLIEVLAALSAAAEVAL